MAKRMKQPGYQIREETVARRLPPSFRPPASFQAFADVIRTMRRGDIGWFAFKHRDPNRLANGDVRNDLVPFMVLPDGGIVGFWFVPGRQPVVAALDSEGQARVIAASWAEFLTRLATRRTKVPDLDDQVLPQWPTPLRKVRLRSPAKLSRAFQAWLSLRAYKAETIPPVLSERVRRGIVRVVRGVGALRHKDDRETLVVTLSTRVYEACWYAGGLKRFPASVALRPFLETLRDAVGRPLRKSEIDVWGSGRVFFESNTELGRRAAASAK